MNYRRLCPSVIFLILLSIISSHAADVPSPESHLGYRPGADFHLARWQTVVDYFRLLDSSSDRVAVRELGKTTEGRPFIVAVVSNEETVAHQAEYQQLQHRLSDPRIKAKASEPADGIAASKPVVLVTCSIHSTEAASTLMAMELAYDLATKNDAATREILDNTILLLVPSMNPDGVEKVALWYERSKGHPWEGSGMVELYHKYAGHDTNRDWFMLNLKETQLLTRMLYQEWFPTISYDVHQMGSRGARIFVPPFFDPINPNLDPRLEQGISLIGAHMATDLASAGKKGVLTHAMYDNWWNGGNRTTPQRHNIVGVLTEAASVRMASPIFVEKDELRGFTRGFASHQPAVNFVDPWPGGWWHLRDIVDYELICARSVLTLAARYRNWFQSDYQALGNESIAKGKTEQPFAWVVPSDQRDPGTAAELVRILHATGIDVDRAQAKFEAGGKEFPAGSWIFPAAQPYRPHLKDMMERQAYPPRFSANGTAEPPYDVSGWTLPLQMGVRVVSIAESFEVQTESVDRIEPPRGQITGASQPAYYVIRNQAIDDFIVLNALLAAGVEVEIATVPSEVVPDRLKLAAGALGFAADAKSKSVLDTVLPTVSTTVLGLASGATLSADPRAFVRIRPQRLGVYQPWVPSMDEGWTRFVLEKFHFSFTTLHNGEIRAGDLRKRVDTLLIPSIDARILRDGYGVDQTEPSYVGGLGREGIDALRDFVTAGGTLICLEDSCTLVIESLALPITNVLKGLSTSVFYAPGSIVGIRPVRQAAESESMLTLGMPDEPSAFFDKSLAFELGEKAAATVAVRFASTDVSESGWLLGPEKLQGKAAVVEIPLGKGRVILFAFPPQHRAQPHGTFRLLFNSLLRGGMTFSK
jgi:Zinc carboxypeptidase